MGSAWSDCYESADTSDHDHDRHQSSPPQRSDLYHASWDPSEAGRYHTDSSSQRAHDADDCALQEVE